VKVSGTATLHAAPAQVYAALNDPAVLVRTIPGCQQLESAGPDRYRMTVLAGVANIRGSYLGDVELADPDPPSGFTLKASGSGAPGTIRADVAVRLDDPGDGTTLLRYDADAVVGGAVGGVGQRVLAGVARRTAGEFFAAVDALLAEPGAEPGAVSAVRPVYRRPQPAERGVRVDVRSQLAGAAVGALIALAGVWLGVRLARRR
jgi:carbon monoxide dehydrogenase subunit G